MTKFEKSTISNCYSPFLIACTVNCIPTMSPHLLFTTPFYILLIFHIISFLSTPIHINTSYPNLTLYLQTLSILLFTSTLLCTHLPHFLNKIKLPIYLQQLQLTQAQLASSPFSSQYTHAPQALLQPSLYNLPSSPQTLFPAVQLLSQYMCRHSHLLRIVLGC